MAWEEYACLEEAIESLSGLCTGGILSDSDGHSPRSQLNYNWLTHANRPEGLSLAQRAGTSLTTGSFNFLLGAWIRPQRRKRRKNSSLKGQVMVRTVAGHPSYSLGVSPENKIVAWNLLRRSLPSKGNGHIQG